MTASGIRTAVARSGRTLLLAFAAALAIVLLPPVGASAHGGTIRLEVAGDGAGGIDVVATWKKDNHPVAQSVAMTAIAVGSGGQKVGPTRIMSAAEGVGFYHADLRLAPGRWKVTVSATEPARTTATVDVTVKEPPADAGGSGAAAGGDPAGGQNSTGPQTARQTGRGGPPLVAVAAAVLVILSAITGALLVRRRRSAGGQRR